MFINEFYAKFAAKQDGSRLFKALRRLSRLENSVLLAEGDYGWPEWPPADDPGTWLEKA